MTFIKLPFIELGVLRRLPDLINFGTPLSGRLTSTTWLALMSELLIKFSYSFDVGDSELNELGAGLSAMTVSVTTQVLL